MLHSNAQSAFNLVKLSDGSAFAALRQLNSPYRRQIDDFIDFLVKHAHRSFSKATIQSYLVHQEHRTRMGRKGEKVTYSASWHNQRLKAVKYVIRYLIEHSPDITNGNRYQIEKYLISLKPKKTRAGIGKIERVPNHEEVAVLVQSADVRLGLMIEFLAETGCRVSEMLSAEIGNARRGDRVTRIGIIGKNGKARDLRCQTALFLRIEQTFQGTRFLFEHHSGRYSRISVTNRIRILAESTIRKPVTAHMLRHYRGTALSQAFGISKASTELGHADIRTTKLFYDHTSLADEEFLKSLE